MDPVKQPTPDELVNDPKYVAQKDQLFGYFDKYIEVRSNEAKARKAKDAPASFLDVILNPASLFGNSESK